MSWRDNKSMLVGVAVAVWTVAIVPCVVICSTIVLAVASPDSSFLEILLALATVASALANIALVVAAVVALRSIGESRRDRNAAAMTDLSQRWDDKHFRDVRLQIRNYAGTGKDSGTRFKEKLMDLRDWKYERYLELLTEPGFLEDLALSIKYRGIYFDNVKDSLGYAIWDRWCLWEPSVMALREERQESTVFEHFERLANRIKREVPGLPDLKEWNGPKY